MKTHHLIVNGDSRKMSVIADFSVHLVITSPPYWQLKDYGSENQIGYHESYEDYINNLILFGKNAIDFFIPDVAFVLILATSSLVLCIMAVIRLSRFVQK